MTGFVHEHVHQLNASLSKLFQDLEVTGDVNESVLESSNSDSQITFLSNASRAIDLASPVLPRRDTVRKHLEEYCATDATTEPALEWLFVAKCAVAIYGSFLSSVLHSTLPLSEAIRYWNSIYGSKRHEAYYALQSAPTRLFGLAVSTVRKVRTTELGLRTLLDSPDHVMNSLFPLYAKMARAQHRHRPRALRRLFSLAHQSDLVLMVHDEVGQCRDALRKIRLQQATRLGLLLKMSPQFNHHDTNQLENIARDTRQCLHLMQSILPAEGHTDIDIQSVLGGLDAISTSTEQPSPAQVARSLVKLLDDWEASERRLEVARSTFDPPCQLTRYWIPAAVVYFAGTATLKYIFHRKDDIMTWIREAGLTARDFAVNWIWEPVVKVWDTVRLKDERLSLLSKDGLRSDLESLERMVVDFARDRHALSNDDTAALLTKVREGDMSLVLKAYEHEIKHPLRNAVSGDLIQMLLIQVQKTKVDVDLATAALDKLLKSNELNFAFLAVAPSMLLTWAGFSWTTGMIRRRAGGQTSKVGKPIRETMRRVERLFNRTGEEGDEQRTSCENQGILMCEVYLLRAYAQALPNHDSIRDLFIEDLRDLENPKLTVAQKLQTIARMSRTWAFLQPHRPMESH